MINCCLFIQISKQLEIMDVDWRYFVVHLHNGNYDVPEGWPMKPYKRPYGGTPGPPVMYEKPSNPEDDGAGYGFKSAGTKEKDVYFHHSDHLGSTSYITDRDGNVTQFVSHKPYGGAFVDEHAMSFETP